MKSVLGRKSTRRAFLGLLVAVNALVLGEPPLAVARLLSGYGTPRGSQLIAPLTVVNNVAVAQTGVPMTFGLPLAPDATGLPVGRTIQVLDGATPVPCQIDRIADVDFNGKQRHVVLTVIGDIGASGTRQFTIQSVVGADPAGARISAPDILATAFDYVTTIQDPSGTYTASARDGLAASSFKNLSTNGTIGRYRDGPYCTEYVCIVPFVKSGVPHPQLRVRFVVTAFKAGTGVVSGTNPIIGIRTDRMIENGNIDNTTPVDNWYNIVSDVCGTYSHSWLGPSPTVNLTLSSNSITVATLTASASFFGANNDCCGWLVTDGTGYGVIASKTSPTVVKIMIAKPFAATTLTPGNYSVYAISHWYGAKIYGQKVGGRAWWSGGKTPDLNIALGTPWNLSDPTSGPFPYISSTKMVPNYTTLPSAVSTNTSTSLDNQGDNPSGLSITSVGSIGASGKGGLSTVHQPDTGQSNNLYLSPVNGYHVNALIRYDSNAPELILKSAEKSLTCPWHTYDNATGRAYRLDAALQLNSSTYAATGQKYMYAAGRCLSPNNPSGSINPWTVQAAHNPRWYYVPAILSGDYIWNDSLQMQAFGLWFGLSPFGHNAIYYGRGYDNTVLAHGSEERGFAWGMCGIGDAAALAPAAQGVLQDSGMWKTHLNHLFTATNSNVAQVFPLPGVNINNVNNTGSGKRFDTTGPRWINPSGTFAGPWQVCFNGAALGRLSEIGLMGADMRVFYNWLICGIIENCLNTTDSVPEYLAPAYFMDVVTYLVENNTTQTVLKTRAEIYRYTAIDPTHGQSRLVNDTAALDALSGKSIHCTLPAGQLGAGTAFYKNGSIVDTYNHSITSVTSFPTVGTGYAPGDILDGHVVGQVVNGVHEIIARQGVLTVTTVDGSGGVTGVSITDGGHYQISESDAYGVNPARAFLPTSRTGSGTGAAINVSINGGIGLITSVGGGNVATLDTTALIYGINGGGVSPPYKTYACRPFATLTMTALNYQIPWSAPGDPLGPDRATYFAGSRNAYMDNLWAAISYAIDNAVPDAADARTWWKNVRSLPVSQPWNVSAR